MTAQVGIVGLGEIAAVHLRALGTMNVEVCAGVDLRTDRRCEFRGMELPVSVSLAPLLARSLDIVIVATPTATHHQICHAILESTSAPRLLLVEKPAVMTRPQLEDLCTYSGDTGIVALLHAEYGPEVLWARARIAGWRLEHGPIVDYRASFADPRRHAQEERYANSWLDSGINALSIAQHFIDLQGVTVRITDDSLSTYAADLSFRDGTGSIATSWGVREPAKSTTVTFRDGARLRLDHQLVAALLVRDDTVLDSYRADDEIPRLLRHYLNAFAKLFSKTCTPGMSPKTRRLHSLLLGDAPPSSRS